MIELPQIRKFTAIFDTYMKSAATQQYMEQNIATFDEATAALNYQQGVDFILFAEDEDL